MAAVAQLADVLPAIDNRDPVPVALQIPCGGEADNAGADYCDVHADCSGALIGLRAQARS